MSWDHLVSSLALRIRQSLDLDLLLQTMVDEVHQLLGCDRVMIYRFNPDWNGRVVVEATSDPQWSVLGSIIHDPCFQSSWIMPYQEKHYFAVEDVATANLTPCHADFLTSLEVKANLAIPIFAGETGDTLWGLLIAHHCQATRSWQALEIEGLQLIADEMGIAIHQASLVEQLQAVKAELEAKVAERTHELEQANTKLAQVNEKLIEKVRQRLRVEAERTRLTKALEASLNEIYLFNADTLLFEYVNQGALKNLGYTLSQMEQITPVHIKPNLSASDFEAIVAPLRQGTATKLNFETVHQRADGSCYPVDVHLQLTQEGDRSVFLAVILDISDRKQLEAERRQEQAQLRRLATIVESSQDAIISKTLAGIITSWNRAAGTLFGYTAAEIIGQPITTIIPADHQGEAQQISDCIHQGQPVETYETQRQHKNGQLVDVAITVSPIHNEAGEIVGTSKIIRDISAQRQIQKALQVQTAILSSFYNSSPLMMGVVELSENDILHISDNQATADFFHTTPDLLQGCWASDLEVPITTQQWLKQYRTSQTQQQPVRFDYIHRTDVDTTWISAAVSFIGMGEQQRPRFSYVAEDISDRKQAELELKSAKDQLELVLQASSEGFWDWDLLTNEIYFSPRWKEMLGYADHELDNSFAMWESVMWEDDRLAAQQLIEAYNSGQVDNFVAIQRFRHKAGSTIQVLSRAIHLKNDQGQVTRMVGSHLNITATIHIQDSLKSSEMQLSSILNSALDGIMAFRSIRDDQGQIIDFEWLLSNPTACQWVHKRVEDLIGQRLLDVLPDTRTDGLFDLYIEVVEKGGPIQRQFHHSHDGIDTWFENIAVKLGDGFTVTFRDISDNKASEQALQTANKTLERHLQDLRQRNTEMLLLSETSDFLQACRTIEEACSVITTLVEPLFPDCCGRFYITCASRNQLETVAQWGNNLHSAAEFYPQDCWSLRRGRWHQITPERSGLRCNHIAHTHQPLSTLCIPMIAQGETLGMFHLSTEKTDALNPAKRQLASTVAEQVGLAIANLNLRETLQHQSIRDGLTGLFNRRYLEEALEKEIARAQRHQSSVAVVMLDVDHFKSFNDTYGHDAGDWVLKAIAQALKDNIRAADTACRYGGEEMTLIFSENSLEEALTLAEHLRHIISQLNVTYGNQRLNGLTASFGVAVFPEHGTIGAALIQAADGALYRAKAAGRNQVIAAGNNPREATA